MIENELKIPLDLTELLKITKNKRLTVGMRAEHIFRGEAEETTHLLEVVNVEQLGNETLLTFEIGKELWTAKWLGQWQVSVGNKVPVNISMKNMSFFDSETGELIKAASTPTNQEVVAI